MIYLLIYTPCFDIDGIKSFPFNRLRGSCTRHLLLLLHPRTSHPCANPTRSRWHGHVRPILHPNGRCQACRLSRRSTLSRLDSWRFHLRSCCMPLLSHPSIGCSSCTNRTTLLSFSFRTSFPYYLTLHQLATQQQQGNAGNEEIKTERTQAEQHQAKVNQQCADKLGVRYSLVHQGRTFLVLGLEPVLQARNDIHTTTRAECGYIGCFHCLSDLAVMNRETAVLPRVAKPLKQCSVTRAKVKVGKGSRCIKIPDMRMSLFRQCCTLYIIWQPRIPSPGTYGHKKKPYVIRGALNRGS